MNLLFLDFETRSEADLPSVGAYRYAQDPTTEILCAAWERENGLAGFADCMTSALMENVIEDRIIVAHNVEFEKSILREVLGIDLPVDRFIDTAAMSARMSLPRKLEEVALFFGLDTAAKDEGKKAIQALSKPRRPTKGDPSKWITPQARPDLFEKLYARCRQDVSLTREIYRLLLPLSEKERKIWQVTIEMNEHGLLIDRESIAPAHALLEADSAPLLQEFDKLTGGIKLKSYVKLAARCGLPDVGKATVRKALRDVATKADVHRILEIYQGLGKSSIAKLDAMLDRMCSDNRVRGSFVYCGAERTARWSANGIQPQNFPRGFTGLEIFLVFRAIERGMDWMEVLFVGCARPAPEPALTVTSTIANGLRGFIVAPPGNTLIVGDLSQIEARTLNWLAGETYKVEMFANGEDLYSYMASAIYGKEINKKDHPAERFMGKQAELGAGYGLGARGFQFMLDDNYDVQISEDFAQTVINTYRAKSPRVTKFWDRVQACFVHVIGNRSKKVALWPEAVREGRPQIFMGTFERENILYAYIELPSGRRLYYAAPSLVSSPKGPQARYFGRDRYSKGWTDVRTYGGKLAENITQALSRDVMAEAMLRLQEAGFALNGTVHDEIISEEEEAGSEEKAKQFHDLMVQVPEWAPGLPLEAEVFVSRRYRK